MRSDVEETETEKTKDSGYSNSSNSQSQRSSGSSKSTSSGSSGFRPSQNQGEGDKGKRSKEKKKEVLQLPEPPEEPGEPGTDLGSAALSQTLTNISRILPGPEPVEVDEKVIAPVPNTWKGEELAKLVWKENAQEDELGIVVSMEDGLVTYTTPTISAMLGYPKDMWVGRSLIDFVHPRHRASFAGHITSVISDNNQGNSEKNLYLCYLRQYRGLRNTGYSLTEKWVGYLPLQLSMSFKGIEKDSAKLYLVINAKLVRSAYKKGGLVEPCRRLRQVSPPTDYPQGEISCHRRPKKKRKHGDETRLSAKFTMRHTSSSQICHVDLEVTPYFGYLPQDILGRSILEFYHPEDLHFLKEVYEAVVKEHGHLFRSKPYRFRCQNGGFALVESELSSFINPWSRKLEFIICQHTVLRGPPNPDVTTPVIEPEALQISEEVIKETEIVQEEIKGLLSETVVRNSETAKQQVTRRCKDLAAFMENLLDEITRPPNLKVDVPTEEQSISERDSVMLGEISPHHEYYDSKSSSETPPSYNQLNYNENMQRFFESKPNTTMPQGSPESKIASGGGEEGKITPVIESIGDSKSGGSGGSSGAQSTESNENSGETKTNGSNENSSNSFKPATLTEELLTRHNEDMEKKMVQKHREQRTKSDTKTKDRMKTSNADKVQEEPSTQGVKRSGSHSWEGEPYKSIKAEHSNREPTPRQDNPPPPFFQLKQDFSPAGFTASPLLPLYYLANRRPDLPIFPQQVPYVPSMLYQPVMLSPQPVVYSPLAVVSGPELPRPAPSMPIVPPPQAAPHMKAGPEHGLNIIINKPDGPLVQDQKTESNETSIPFEDSNSSFYSLLKTDKSDESQRSSSENDAKQEASVWQLGKKGEWRPIKKVAPWDENITVTPELVLKYQLQERPLADILSQDLNTLATITQPELVSEQLSQMYLDLEKEGVSQQLEGVSCSSESSSEETKTSCRQQEKKYMEYDKMAIMFEEDAPLPPPILQSCT